MQHEHSEIPAEHKGAARWAQTARALVALWAAALLLALYPYTGNPAAPIKLLLSGWGAVALALCVWLAARRDRTCSPAVTPALGLAAGWIVIQGFAALRLGMNPETLGPAVDALAPLVIFWVIAFLAAPLYRATTDARRLAVMLMIAAAVSSLYGFCQRMGLDPFPWAVTDLEEYRGLPATYGNPNFAGHVLVIAIPLAAALAWQRLPWGLVPLGLMGTHLALTGMRGGWVGLGAAGLLLGVAAVVRNRPWPAPRRAVAALLITVTLGVALGGAALAAHRLVQGSWLPADGSLVLRYQGYAGAARMALERPLLGWGPGQYALENPRYWTAYEQRWFASEGRLNDHVHNEPLETAVDGGLLAVVLLGALFAYATLASLHLAFTTADPLRRRLAYGLAAAFAAFAMDGLFGFNLRVPASAGLFFLLLGLLDALSATPAPERRWARITAPWALGLATACALVFSLTFQAERLLQRSHGALAWALEQSNPGMAQPALEEAREAAGRAAMLRVWDARMHLAQAEALGLLGHADDAAKSAALAAHLEPNSPARLTASAQRYLSVAATAGASRVPIIAMAQDLARGAVALCPGYAPAEEVLGRAALALAEADPEAVGAKALFDGARTHLGTALQGALPQRANLEILLSRACLGAGDATSAVAALRRALEWEPDRMPVWEQLQQLAETQGDASLYLNALSAQVRRASNDAALRLTLQRRLAAAYAATPRDAALAHAVLDTVLREDPSRLEDWGRFLATAPASALETVLRARVGERSEAQRGGIPALVLGAYQALDGGTAAWEALATQTSNEAHTLPASDPATARAMLGWLLPLLGRVEAEAPADSLLRERVRAACGAILVAAHSWAEAEARLAAPFTALPRREQPDILSDRAAALAGLGRTAEALELAREAHRRGSSRIYPRLTLARLLMPGGQYDEARYLYHAVLADLPAGPFATQVQSELTALEAAAVGDAP
jgi:O-antigen ligase